MLTWSSVLFGLGVLAFFDSLFNVGDIFRRVNSVLFMLVSLALFLRTTTKMKIQKSENCDQRILDLEYQVKSLTHARDKLREY